jgi:5-methylcytosine-specific restriction endonuclease McrA
MSLNEKKGVLFVNNKRYFTGIPCQNGHISERRISDNVCISCERAKEKRYLLTVKGKISLFKKNNCKKGRERKLRYSKTEKGRIARNRNNKTVKGKASRKRFDLTEKGKACSSRNQHARKLRKLKQGYIQYSFQDRLKRFSMFNNKCAYCMKEEYLSEDHFIPISKGGEHRIENIVPSCLSCNKRKNAQHPKSWYEKQPFYSKDQWEKILCLTSLS